MYCFYIKHQHHERSAIIIKLRIHLRQFKSSQKLKYNCSLQTVISYRKPWQRKFRRNVCLFGFFIPKIGTLKVNDTSITQKYMCLHLILVYMANPQVAVLLMLKCSQNYVIRATLTPRSYGKTN